MKKKILFVAVILLIKISANAQSVYLPYAYQFYQKLDSSVYSNQSRFHSSMKPFLVDDPLISQQYQSLMNAGVDSVGKRSWVHRKLFNEHLVDIKNKEYTAFFDYLPDLTAGRDFSGNRTTWLNTRGYQVGGTIGSKFYFYTSGYENQAVFPNYLNNYINSIGIVTGQSYDRNYGTNTKDWSYVTALLSYTPIKYLNITLGQDKNFIGDGYRSVLLSDFASNYPFLKLTGTLGNVRYMAMWANMQDPLAPKLSYQDGNRQKWGVFHYLDWNVSNKVSLGFFDSVIWADKDDQGNKRGFDFNYVNPFVFLRPVEANIGSGDNALIGFTGKYKFVDKSAIYGQFALDEFHSKTFFSNNGSYFNKYAWQLGVRGADLLAVKRLNYLLEFNNAKPYTYSEVNAIINYAQNAEPLAHPFGANFREVVGILNYSIGRFDFYGQAEFGHYGLDPTITDNYGKDIFKLYPDASKFVGNYTGQGITTNLYYGEGRIAYMLNPKYNLRLELGGILRQEKNALSTNNTALVTIGLRSSFRNLYSDF
ncbi:gliding motility protein RemB [Mucilaginibacter arboris]|uniref:Gliding motility protein RemB n=1 Tax=Mucilaginibacter arboris TaxID=2682090 RepID=A0A7K1SRQ6_9SPHI|nr:gliding motility protein RemB [Mucilaginibacter arboris]MVN19981.1 gliding motility protein RemB [Mucilaginibacter arboris]